jgi:hypothetical protein
LPPGWRGNSANSASMLPGPVARPLRGFILERCPVEPPAIRHFEHETNW